MSRPPSSASLEDELELLEIAASARDIYVPHAIFCSTSESAVRHNIRILRKNPYVAARESVDTPRDLAFNAYIENFNQQLQAAIDAKPINPNAQIAEGDEGSVAEGKAALAEIWSDATKAGLTLQFGEILTQEGRDWIGEIGDFIKLHYAVTNESIEGFSILILRAAFYLNNDEQNESVAPEKMEGNLAELRAAVSLRACVGGDYGALFEFCGDLMAPAGALWQNIKPRIVADFLPLCSSGNQAHVPSFINMLVFNKIKGDENLFAASSGMMMENVRLKMEGLITKSYGLVQEYLVQESLGLFDEMYAMVRSLDTEEEEDMAKESWATESLRAGEKRKNLAAKKIYFTQTLAEKFLEHPNELVRNSFCPDENGRYREFYFDLYCAYKRGDALLVESVKEDVKENIRASLPYETFESNPLLNSISPNHIINLIDSINVVNTYAAKNMPLPLWIADMLFELPIFRNINFVSEEKISALAASYEVYQTEKNAENEQIFHQNITSCLRDLVAILRQAQIPICLIGDESDASLNFFVRRDNSLPELLRVGATFREIDLCLASYRPEVRHEDDFLDIGGLLFHPHRLRIEDRLLNLRYNLTANIPRAILLGDERLLSHRHIALQINSWHPTEGRPQNRAPNLLLHNLQFIYQILRRGGEANAKMIELLKLNSEDDSGVLACATTNHPNPAVVLEWISNTLGEDVLVELLVSEGNQYIAESLLNLSLSVFKEFADKVFQLNTNQDRELALYNINLNIFNIYSNYPSYREQALLYAEIASAAMDSYGESYPWMTAFRADCLNSGMRGEVDKDFIILLYTTAADQYKKGYVFLGEIQDVELESAIYYYRKAMEIILETHGDASESYPLWQNVNYELGEIYYIKYIEEDSNEVADAADLAPDPVLAERRLIFMQEAERCFLIAGHNPQAKYYIGSMYDNKLAKDAEGRINIPLSDEGKVSFLKMTRFYNEAKDLGNQEAKQRLVALGQNNNMEELLQLSGGVNLEGEVLEANAARLSPELTQDKGGTTP